MDTHADHRSHPGAGVVAGTFGILLLALGVSHLGAALTALDADAVIWDVYGRKDLPLATLKAAAADVASADRWSADGELDGDRGLVLLRAAETAPPAERAGLLRESAAATETALAEAPGQPSAWARLAYLRSILGDMPGAVKAMRLSFLSGSFVPALMTSRVELAMRLLPAMDLETVELLKRQIRLIWIVKPNYVNELSMRPEAEPLVRAALSELGPEEIARFQHLHGDR